MGAINLLDCTLRDGGYVNGWRFGSMAIRNILSNLVAANLDIIECGYLSFKKKCDNEYSVYNSIDALLSILPEKNQNQSFAVMINYGECSAADMPDAKDDFPIVRVCFHKKDKEGAFAFYRELKNKGYRIFVQPMATLSYTDTEFIELIQCANELSPECFYIVDSFGALELRDFERFLTIADKNLNKDIMLGYHAHNNLQQAYGNAKYMVEQRLLHDIVIDASVYGMGRGAGNLNMELFASFLNREFSKNYAIEPLLEIIDGYLKPIFNKTYWGYSLPFYLSARHNCHPNYASYFSEKNTLSNKSLNELLASLKEDDKAMYSEALAEVYYQSFQRNNIDDSHVRDLLSEKLKGRDLLVLAPGSSISLSKDKILSYIEAQNPIIIGINSMSEWYHYDYLMCTNEKRLNKLGNVGDTILLLSSNLHSSADNALIFNYSSYLVDDGFIVDNPVLMLFKMLHLMGLNKVSIAGFDGYVSDADRNYFSQSLSMGTSAVVKMRKNEAIARAVAGVQTYMELNFLTDSIYVQK